MTCRVHIIMIMNPSFEICAQWMGITREKLEALTTASHGGRIHFICLNSRTGRRRRLQVPRESANFEVEDAQEKLPGLLRARLLCLHYGGRWHSRTSGQASQLYSTHASLSAKQVPTLSVACSFRDIARSPVVRGYALPK